MSKEIYISSTPHETRLAIVENDELTEIYYERENEYTLAGSIYNGRVTRVLPGMQSSFVDIGLERDAFLYITDFMEEAGESADFEGGTDSGESRSSRDGNRRGGDRGDRGDRGERPTTIEGTVAAPATTSEEGSPRSDRGERSERGDRNDRGERGGRGRNRRGRGDRDRDRSADPARSADATRPPESIAPPASTPSYLVPANPTEGSDSAELGEGAPGADGSRRWRGRRGRRRGRGGLTADGTRSPEGAVTATEANGTFAEKPYAADSETEAPAGRYDQEDFTDYPLEIDGNAAPAVVDEPIRSVEAPREARSEGRRDDGRRDRNDRGGRDRGGRGRGDGRDRGGREDRGDRSAPRAPRGFAPSRDLYVVDTPGSDSESSAPVEPIILPGESLSKYRIPTAAEEAAQAAAQSTAAALPPGVILPTPKSVVDDTLIATGWDGGAVLPGETLSRRNRPEAGNDSGNESRRDSRREDRGRREPREPRASHRIDDRANLRAPEAPKVVEDAEGVAVQSAPEEQPEVAQAGHPEQVPEHEILHEAATIAPEEVSIKPEPVPAGSEIIAAAPETETPAAIVDPHAEYEPEEASASYRIDPVAPSEFRQSAPMIEPEIVEPASAENATPANEFSRILERAQEQSQPVGELNETAHLDTTGVPPPPPPVFATESHVEPHVLPADVTSITETGEMHSSSPVDSVLPELTEDTVELSTSPIQHEHAIHEPHELLAASFAPGQGALEEEILDEDDHELSLHAGYDEEFEDLEEETLEGAADLGTMLREMSIDQITSPADAEQDEDEDDDSLDEFEEEEAQEGEYSEDFGDSESEGDADSDSDKPQHSAADAEFFANTFREPNSETTDAESGTRSNTERRPRREGGRDGRRGRSGNRDRGSDRGSDRSSGGDRDRSSARSTGGEHDRSRHSGGRRQSAQATNLPAISDLLKPGQEILVQIAKEPIAKKGARITSHIALPGRFLVFMPTVNHTGVSRKIESDGERRRLKEILLSEKGEASGGFIVRTAAAGASEEELRSDLRFLLNLWADIKQRSESSKSPALIYHDLNLVERILRDQVTDTFSAIWVDTETEYERVLRFLQRFQPSLIRRVKLYTKEVPLFEQFGITEEINKALRSKVWLKSGGSIVINQTEALVAIDINTGKYVGKTARLEDTIVKTNLDAIPEIVRQIRLRDLGGIIIIDFIDMDERRNRNKVMAALEEELKTDRAPSKVLQFNDFGLVAITRKRVKQSLERTLSTTCGVCQGTGMVKSPVTVCNDIYIEMRKMHKHLDRGDVMLRVHPEVIKQLKSGSSKWLQEMEEMVGKTILIKSDPSLHPEQFDIH